MPFALTFLGTDTTFAAKDNFHDYPQGETLSLANLLLVKEDKTHDPSDCENICNPTHTIIDGPTTLATEVYQRMNLGLFRLLNAVSRNQQDLQIVGHSRGACEAILVSHEFDRLKTLFDAYPEVQIEARIAEIRAQFKQSIVKGLNIEALDEATFFSADNLKAIKRNISNANVSLFLIDPVPGGSYLGIDHAAKAAEFLVSPFVSRVPSIKWDDPLLYRLPACVNHLEQFVFEDERTCCFKPIVPVKRDGMDYYSVQSLPGHHGTGSGNPYDQQKTFRNPSYDIHRTLDVQKLIFTKLIKFLQLKGHAFDTTIYPVHSSILGHIAEKTLVMDPTAYNKHIIQLKENILENIEFYKKFEQTAYPYLGQEHGYSSPRRGNGTSRIIHHGSKENSNLCDVIPNGRTQEFLDWEHMELVMQSLLKGPFNHLDPITCIRSLKEAMQNKTPHFKALQNGLLTTIINGLSCEFIAENLNLSDEQIPLFLTELNSLMEVLKGLDAVEVASNFTIVENALTTSLRKKIDRLYKTPIEIIQNKLTKDVQSLEQFLSCPSIQSPENMHVRAAFDELKETGQIRALPKLSESPFNEQVLEIFSRWAPDQIQRNNQSVLPKLCQNYKKLLELQQLILFFKDKSAIYSSEKFEAIELDFEVIRTNILETMRQFKIPLNEVYRCFNDQDTYNHFSRWFFEKYPDVASSKMTEPLHQLSVRLEDLKKQRKQPIRQVQVRDFYALVSREYYPHDKTRYYQDNIAHIELKLSELEKISSDLDASLIEIKRLHQLVIDNKTTLQSLVKKASTTYAVFRGYIVELEQKQTTLSEIERTAIDRLRVINEEKAKTQELHTQGKGLVRLLRKYQSNDAKTDHLFSAIVRLKQQVTAPISLGDNSSWYEREITRFNSMIEEITFFETHPEEIIAVVSQIQIPEQIQVIQDLSRKRGELIELKQQATDLKDKLSQLNQIYTRFPVPQTLIELDEELPVFPEQPNIAVLNNFHKRTMDDIQELQRVIEAYTRLNQELRKEAKWQLIDDKISQYETTIRNLQQRQLTLESHIGRITSNTNSFYENWLQQLIKTTTDYQKHLNAQHPSEQLTRKKEITATLFEALNTQDQPPYVNISQFKQHLELVENELTLHRDPDWKRYLGLIAKSMFIFALLVGAVVAALTPCLALGIGIAVASLFSMGTTVYKKQSFENWSLFSSKGEMFVETVKIVPVWEGGL